MSVPFFDNKRPSSDFILGIVFAFGLREQGAPKIFMTNLKQICALARNQALAQARPDDYLEGNS